MGGCLKTNLYPIKTPHDIFTFEILFPNNENLWKFLKSRIKGKDVIAAPYGKKVYAYGYSEQIHEIFTDCLNGEISRSPISVNELKENPVLKSVVIKALICGLAAHCGKEASISKRMIWDRACQFKIKAYTRPLK